MVVGNNRAVVSIALLVGELFSANSGTSRRLSKRNYSATADGVASPLSHGREHLIEAMILVVEPSWFPGFPGSIHISVRREVARSNSHCSGQGMGVGPVDETTVAVELAWRSVARRPGQPGRQRS